MKEIMLITTKGCEGCSIMRKSILQALSLTRKENIEFTEVDYNELLDKDRRLYKQLNLRDFPTTVFRRNNRVVRKEIGTRPNIVVLRWIDIDFK